jgi:phosphohistidine phosphatase SixA
MPKPSHWSGFLLVAAMAAAAHADEALWSRIAAEPNIVVLTRHMESAGTNPLAWDPSGRCEGEHRLTAKGRADARTLGRLFAERSIKPFVISSPMCRCKETADIAFGGAYTDAELRETASGDAQRMRAFERKATGLLAQHRGKVPVVFVSHRPNIDALTMELVDDGDLLVGRIGADGQVEVLGKMRLPQ